MRVPDTSGIAELGEGWFRRARLSIDKMPLERRLYHLRSLNPAGAQHGVGAAIALLGIWAADQIESGSSGFLEAASMAEAAKGGPPEGLWPDPNGRVTEGWDRACRFLADEFRRKAKEG
jgi:hypothetical protein